MQPQVTDAVKWPGDPLQPTFCTDDETVRALCDWGSRGRQVLHDEYCEYAVVNRRDPSGRSRPKRVQVTTELREYWLTLAVHDPDRVRAITADMLGTEPSWSDLYGVPDPHSLGEEDRRLRFATTMAGHGGDPELKAAGVAAVPAGRLNTENALFMTHPVNGLDDLLFIVLFGARRFAVGDGGAEPRRAGRDDIFARRKQLACRHADPVAALAAYGQVLAGRMLAFADPLGIYLRGLNTELFRVGAEPLPPHWVRWSRGEEGMFQRLEFGPADDDDAYLDDIDVVVGAERQALSGGYQLLRELEVGPLLATGVTRGASEEEFEVLPAGEPIECNGGELCASVRTLEREHRRASAQGGADASRHALRRGRLQDGIYHAPGSRPGKFFALMFLRAADHCDARRAGERLADLWQLYAGLERGRIPDLDPVGVPHEGDNLKVLLGIGPNAFRLAGIDRPKPNGLEEDRLFASPRPGGGGPLLVGSGLEYAAEVRANLATEEFCLQFTGDSKLAVDRTIVETWKRLSDLADPETGAADLEPTTFYLGFQRSDRRSWIDFHDGLSNMRSEDREGAIAIDPGMEEEWCVGGTYLAFLRLGVDLPAWRRLSRAEQELLVGRDKLSGCPIVSVDAAGRPVADPGCPVAGTQIWEEPNDPRFAEPPASADPVVAQSHVQRANHHVEPASDPGSRRIFRQGYEFLEWAEGSPGFRVGLNFVSFQDTTERLIRMLTNEGWLGRVNFGGDPVRQPPGMASLLSVYAAAVFLAPPRRDGEPFPGAAAFGL